MKPPGSPTPALPDDEIASLIATLRETGQRIEELTGGELDSVIDHSGRTFLFRDVQQHLRRIEDARQAAILNALPAHIALVDVAGAIVSVNEAWRRFGSANAMTGRAGGPGVNYLEVCDRASGDDAAEARQAAAGIRAVLDGSKKEFLLEYPCNSPSEQRWFLMTVTPLAGGRSNGAVVMHLDITRRKLSEQELRAFGAAMDALADAIYVVDRASMKFTHVNDAACRMLSRTHAELLALTPWEILSVSRTELEDTYDKLIASGREGEPTELLRPRAGGARAWVELRRHAVRSGDLWSIVTLVRDITERKKADEKIARLSRVHALLSGINSAIVRNREHDALFGEVCRLAVAEGGFTIARAVELDANGKARIAASTDPDSRTFQLIVDQYNGDPENCPNLLALALRGGQPLVANDVASDPRMPNRAELTKDGSFAVAVLPLAVDGRVSGAIILRAREAGMFDEIELQLLLEVALNLSFALEHIEKEAKVRRLTRVYAVLSGINTLIVHVRDRDELFREACRIAIEDGKFAMAWIGVVDRASMTIEPVASAGAEPEFLAQVKGHFPMHADAAQADTMSARAVRDRKAVVSNDIRTGPNFFFKSERIESGILSIAVLPLLVGNDVAGVIALYAREAGFFDEVELKLLTELANDIAFAIDHIGKRERLEYLAYYDELTGLANRGLFLERVAQYMRSAAAGGHKLGLFLIDIERFRNINDSLGRPAGDALLKQVADWLTANLGDANLLARVGMDHFAVVLPEVSVPGNVTRLLEKTMAAFLAHPFQLNDAVFRIAVKVGAAVYPDDGTDAESLFRHAEAALKLAKAKGERYLFFQQKMSADVAGQLSLENQLREALDREEFVLHYQPKVDLATGRLTGAEALIRWNDPRTGLVPPGRFIPILEETGMIYEVGRWAMRKAIEDYLRWRAAGLPAVRIAVNVSPLQLRNRGFIDEIGQVLAVDPQAAAGLELEITESLIMADINLSVATLQAIRTLGVSIAIDDFGTGFSSLSYLARLPVDTLKIDRSFVNDMTVTPQGLGLVSTIISLAHSLKLKVVAEGVETEEQSRLLRLLRCDEMQGFLFSKPVPAEIFETRFLTATLPA